MSRMRIAALVFSLACCGALTAVSTAASHTEWLRVHNTTGGNAWITLYASVPGTWVVHRLAQPNWAGAHGSWQYERNGKDDNGPWMLRFEVKDASGRLISEHDTKFWYDGAQHNYNTPGDPVSNFFVCENPKWGYFWSIDPGCGRNDNA